MDETELDTRRIVASAPPPVNPRSTSDAATSASSASGGKKPPKFDPEALYYDMTGEKFLVIFNHYDYSLYARRRRIGTFEDVAALQRVFSRLGFKIFTYTDLKYEEIIDAMKNIANQDHTLTSCLAVVILTHGDKDGVVYAADRGYHLQDVISILETGHIGLVNKPKLFFIQACRGNKLDDGRTVRLDGSGEEVVVPSHVDFVTMHASVEGYKSSRNKKHGSCMIQELCKAIDNHHNDMDLLQLITLTNRNVAYLKKKKKQAPETRFTLTKLSSISDAATASSGGKKPPKFEPAALYYDMTGEKFMGIFNHYKYEKLNDEGPRSRKGTGQDVLALRSLFSKLGFKMRCDTDLKYDAIIDVMTDIANQDHTLTSCLAVVILTHGGEDGELYAADRGYHLQDVISILETGNIGLDNKLKLCFVQACRGGKRDKGRTIRIDGLDEEFLVPLRMDFLIMYSTVDGYVSYRDELHGSWMIQVLCNAIENHHDDMNLLQVITHTNKKMTYLSNYILSSDMQTLIEYKQIPETCFTLTKLVQL